MIYWDAPLTPDEETARQWAIDELSTNSSGSSRNLLQIFFDWIDNLFNWLSDINLGSANVPLMVFVLLGVIALVAISLRFVGPARKARSARARGDVTLDDDPRSAAEMREAAAAAAANSDWSAAVLDRFRAIVRGVEERLIIDEQSGRTAYEAAVAASGPLPDHAPALVAASGTFGAVFYGHSSATEADYQRLRALDEAIVAARPRLEVYA